MAVTITPAAAQRIRALTQDGGVFRLAVAGGGCSGFRYVMEIAPDAAADDQVNDADGARVVVDPVSADLLGGVVLDWVDDLTGSRFEVANPNARSGCGCGASFAV